MAAAAEVLYERGLFDTRIGDIAARAGTSSPTILYYFDSKDRLLEEAVDYTDRDFYSRLWEGQAQHERASDKLVHLIEQSSLGPVGISDYTLWMEIWVRARRSEAVRTSYFRLDRRQRELIADIVRDGQASGEFMPNSDADDVALMLERADGRAGRAGDARAARRDAGADGGSLPGAGLDSAGMRAGAHGCDPKPRDERSKTMSTEASDGSGPNRAGTNRRTFIKRATATMAGLSAPGLLAACGTTAPTGGGSSTTAARGPGGLPLARPYRPVTLPIYADNKAIASGMAPEKGPLQFYNWTEYINQDVVNAFEKKYGVKVQISTFTTIDEAVSKIASGEVQFDVFVPELVFLERLVVGKVLQPLNLSYIPNLRQNVWPSLASPWYDVGSRYTVPYTVYTTGIGWRADKLPGFNPANYPNPWSALWVEGPKISGKVGVLDDQHEGLALALLHNGVTDVNTESPAALNAAQKSLIQLVNKANLKFDTNEFQHLADGSSWLHQAWSGDMAATPAYAPQGTKPSAFAYWWPTDGRGPIDNDTFAVLRGAKNPVLAHLFINFLLDNKQAFNNFTYLYYQQPLNAMTPEAVVKQGLIAPNLRNTIIREAQFKNGLVQGPLSQRGEVLWENAWAAVQSS